MKPMKKETERTLTWPKEKRPIGAEDGLGVSPVGLMAFHKAPLFIDRQNLAAPRK